MVDKQPNLIGRHTERREQPQNIRVARRAGDYLVLQKFRMDRSAFVSKFDSKQAAFSMNRDYIRARTLGTRP